MANLGNLLGISPQHLVLRTQYWDESKTIAAIGEAVFTVEKKRVGVISDIFGPVAKPFISVRLMKSHSLTLESFKDKRGMSFYSLPGKPKAKKFTKSRSGKSNRPTKRRPSNRFPKKNRNTKESRKK